MERRNGSEINQKALNTFLSCLICVSVFAQFRKSTAASSFFQNRTLPEWAKTLYLAYLGHSDTGLYFGNFKKLRLLILTDHKAEIERKKIK